MNQKIILTEISLKGIKSSGPGGQHVNKVSTKIELTFDLKNSAALSENEKNVLAKKLANRISKDSNIILQCEESRSQFQNKKIIIQRFLDLLFESLKRPKIRKNTKPTKGSIKRRLDSKKSNNEKKANRKKLRF